MLQPLIIVDHYRVANLAIIHGLIVLLTGLLMMLNLKLKLSPSIIKHARLIHVVSGFLTVFYGTLTYIITP